MRAVTRTLMIALGWILLVPGMVFLILPPPFAFGIFMVLPGIAILVANSKGMRRLVQRIRGRYRMVNISLGAVENRGPGWLTRSLKRTNPAARVRAMKQRRARKKAQTEPLRPAALKTE